MESTILDSIGAEIIGVMSPVSISMLLVVLLVYSLSSPLSPSAPIITAASLVYSENSSDSATQKLEGALLNAIVFVVLVAAVTFLVVLLYYYNCSNFLKYYMGFSSFFVLGTMGGSIFLSLIQHFSIPVDSFTFSILLFNFTIVGVLSVFSRGVPILLNQGYMIGLGIVVAAWFTKLPEWTTWVLLVALALYDLVAVLAPGGPLKILVELASNRDEDLPALVYETRPAVSRNPSSRASGLGLFVGMVSEPSSIELQVVPGENAGENSEYTAIDVQHSRDNELEIECGEVETFLLVHNPQRSDSEITINDSFDRNRQNVSRPSEIEIDEERSPLVERLHMVDERGLQEGDHPETSFSKGIKLGLGDFVFYSVLVGRAAMYDLMTVYACYLAVISGVGCTLILLAVCRHALPALPISIMLGVMFYFLTRLLMEPFVVGTSTNLMMF